MKSIINRRDSIRNKNKGFLHFKNVFKLNLIGQHIQPIFTTEDTKSCCDLHFDELSDTNTDVTVIDCHYKCLANGYKPHAHCFSRGKREIIF